MMSPPCKLTASCNTSVLIWIIRPLLTSTAVDGLASEELYSGATGMSSSALATESIAGAGRVEGTSSVAEIRRDVSCITDALFSSVKLTHFVSSINDSAAMAPMRSVRCKSIIKYLWPSGGVVDRVGQGLLPLRARDGIVPPEAGPDSFP